MGNRRWTQEEIEYLSFRWGNIPIESIARKLNRSVTSIKVKKDRLGLNSFTQSSDKGYMPKTTLFAIVFGQKSIGYKNVSMILNRGLKTHKVKCSKKYSYEGINIDEFFDWAYENRSFLDFSNFEKYGLGPEPKWVDIKRRQDIRKKQKFHFTPWTKKEDNELKRLLKKKKYTCTELSRMLQRTEGAIRRRIQDLKIKDRPVSLNCHIKWTDEEYKKLGRMIKNCNNYEEMSEQLNKSVKAIRGRVYQYYLTENLDKARKIIGDGEFFDNMPDKQLKHKNLFTAGERVKINNLLVDLIGTLQKQIDISKPYIEQFKGYFQKDMCCHWSNLLGCKMGECNCDECTCFKRIEKT